ncbi:hypothetical protein [Candidatus Mycolicibacterium alkanivorans]|uniref:Uncharacterized protein n=1 Tax=Candidatus Mycolicibacterium alkanivorans TaxID=2954114 RepID=A0ABS9YU83_9MYCO|nr:hypothetical protein [Candidatus Mycolicibacterium alkanivorans]MCI4674781.1 hypothetical protein [Candidatus Mycolicibacterium alkanivorans]
MNTIPIATISAETGVPIQTIAEQLCDAIRLNEAGLRSVPTAVSRRYLDDLRAARQAQADQHRTFMARMAELAARHPARGGIPASSGSAFADMLGADQR